MDEETQIEGVSKTVLQRWTKNSEKGRICEQIRTRDGGAVITKIKIGPGWRVGGSFAQIRFEDYGKREVVTALEISGVGDTVQGTSREVGGWGGGRCP